ncbi:MAG: hypothetical protein IJS86_05045, partial [Lachnospiraceae bacterium]|nr:hypothetical protein [Lachnospiraceae bacterium]
ESAYQYGTVVKFGEWGDAVTAATVNEWDITAREFVFTKASECSYALTSEKASNVKTLSWNVLDALSKVEEDTVIVTSENAAEEGKTKALLPGGTYYLYTKGPKAEGKFTRYAQEPAEVTLGAVKNIVIKPRHDGKKIVLSNDDVRESDFEIFVDSVSVVSVNGADFDFDKEINPVGLGLTYYLSGNNFDEAKELGSFTTKVAGGTYTLTVSGAPNGSDAKREGYRKNEYNITYAPGEFYVGSADSKLVVTTKGSYYFGQSVGEKTVGEDSFFDVRLDGKSGAYKWDALKAEVSANAFTTGGAAPGTVDSTTSANGSFYVKFYSEASSTISSGDAIRVEVTARPVYIGAKYNFFKKTGDDVSAEKVEMADLELFDVEEGRKVSYYIKGGLAIDPSSVISTDESAVARKYMLSVSGNDYATKEVSDNAANGNYIITAGAAEGYAYYVFPVYNVSFNGQFKSARYEGETISSGDVKSVSSDSAKRIEEYKGQERKKDISYTTTAVVNMPEDIVVNGEFMGWKSDLSQERISGKTDTITNDVIYTATVKSRIPGFTSSENSLMVEFDADNAVYTGMKHVTNPVEQMENHASEAGRMNALTTLVDNANKGTPDITLNIYVGGRLLLEGYDYKAVYKNNINAFDYAGNGVTKKTPQVTVTFKGGYKQYPSFTRYFGIKRANICDGALVLGTPTESRYYKEKTNASKVKPGLYNVNTGAGLVLNNNGKKDLKLDIINSNGKAETGKLGAGDYRVVITGTNNYDGKIEDAVISVKSKADFEEVKLKANVKNKYKMDFEQVLSRIDMDSYIIATEDDKWLRAGIIEAMGKTSKTNNLSADSLEFDTSMASRVKGQDYSTPGTKKISYKAYLPVENSEKVYVLKGTFQYIINKAEASKISISWAEIPGNVVPYAPTGATLNFTSTQYNGVDADLTKIIKVAYSKNMNPGKTARATVKAVKGAYVNGKLTGLVKEFLVGKAVISENNVALAYIVKADWAKGTAPKIQSAVAKRGSVVVKDDLGNVLNAGSDYDLELRPKTESGKTVSINIVCKGKKYEGKFTVNGRVLDTNFLGKLKLKNMGTGSAKNFSEAEMKSLEGVVSADEVNRIAADHKIDVYDGVKALQGAGKDYNIVITPAGRNGLAYVTAVGIDGGAYGGSDVLASAAIKVRVK